MTAEDHADFLERLPYTHPHLLASRQLLAEMTPSDYVVLATDSDGERPWAFIAANYAASLGAPILVVDGSGLDRDLNLPRVTRLLNGRQWLGRGGDGRDMGDAEEPAPAVPLITMEVLGPAGRHLSAMAPRYVGFVTSRVGFPIELVGDAPLANRFALGRLAGPDLTSTALLVARAGLTEDLTRPPVVTAVVAEASMAMASRPLPGARAEAAAVRATLTRRPNVEAMPVEGDGDLVDFVALVQRASLVHFAGHGRYDDHEPARSGLIFHGGVFSAGSLREPLHGGPIIFSNACESGVLRRPQGGRQDAGWTGLAAAFILHGAVNYLGSLWPIYDDRSQQIAESFYDLLCAGTPVGEALRQARLGAYDEGDATWAAFILFACPRNRLRPMSAQGG